MTAPRALAAVVSELRSETHRDLRFMASADTSNTEAIVPLTAAPASPADRVFSQGFQTGATVAVRDVRLSSQ
jgi:hypothetical protein